MSGSPWGGIQRGKGRRGGVISGAHLRHAHERQPHPLRLLEAAKVRLRRFVRAARLEVPHLVRVRVRVRVRVGVRVRWVEGVGYSRGGRLVSTWGPNR